MGDPAQKVDVELPVHELEWVAERARLEGRTVSEVLLEAVQHLRRQRAWESFRDATLKDQPPLIRDELEAAERELQG